MGAGKSKNWARALGKACRDPQMKGTLEMFEQRHTFLAVWPSAGKLVMTAAPSLDSPSF